MTIDENLNKLASNIFKHGTLENGDGCLQPSCYTTGENDDAIIDEYDVTHYDRHWVEPGKSVKLKFYRAEAFGASYPDLNNVIFETVINF